MDEAERISALMTHPAFSAIAVLRAIHREDLDEVDRIMRQSDPWYVIMWTANLLARALAMHDDKLDAFLDYVASEVFQQLEKRTCPDTPEPGNG